MNQVIQFIDKSPVTVLLDASWEGFAIEQVLAMLGSDNAYFWSTQRGAINDTGEIHLIIV
jgi:hypothetical protein